MGHAKSNMAKSGGKVKSKLMKYSATSIKDLLTRQNLHVNSILHIDECEGTPLWFAVRYGEEDLTRMFLEAGANVNESCGLLCTTPLHMAAYDHNVAVTKLLLSFGANPNILDKWNYTPLMYAAMHYDPCVVRELFVILIKFGASVNFGATLNVNRTLEQASSFDFPRLTKGLDEYISFNKEPMGAISGTALHLAMQNPHLPSECIDILLEAGAMATKLNLNAQTPLMCALSDIYFDYHKNVKNHFELLLKQTPKQELNIQDMRGWNSFHYAAERGSISCMELLLTVGCDCDTRTFQEGETPLWILLIRGWKEGLMYLLRNGCDVNHPLESVRILVMNSDVNVCRYGKMLPVEFAMCNKLYDVAELMIKVGCKIDINSLVQSQQHETSQHYLDFVQFVNRFTESLCRMQSLYSLCRTVIRNTLNQGIEVKLKLLSLPQCVQDFLCFGDITVR